METLGENSIPLQGLDPSEMANGAQNLAGNIPSVDAGVAVFLGMLVIFLLFISLLCYVFFAICLMKIAKKTNTPNQIGRASCRERV